MPKFIVAQQKTVLGYILRDLEYLEGACDAVKNGRGVERVNNIRSHIKKIRKSIFDDTAGVE